MNRSYGYFAKMISMMGIARSTRPMVVNRMPLMIRQIFSVFDHDLSIGFGFCRCRICNIQCAMRNSKIAPKRWYIPKNKRCEPSIPSVIRPSHGEDIFKASTISMAMNVTSAIHRGKYAKTYANKTVMVLRICEESFFM